MAEVRSAQRLRESVAEEVRVAMVRKRVRGAALAQQIGRSEAYLSRRLTGNTAFDLDDLQAISDVLDIDVADLLPAREDRDENRDTDLRGGLRKRKSGDEIPAVGWSIPRQREPVVSGTVAHPGHPIVAGAARIPAQRNTTIGVRKTSPTGR